MNDFAYKRKIKGKTIPYYIENFSGCFCGVVTFLICFFVINTTFEKNSEFIKNYPQIGLVVFGFLLTFLSIILQSDSKLITSMKESKKLFSRFVKLNKNIVYLSFSTSIYAYLIYYMCSKFVTYCIYIDRFIVALLFALVIKLTVDTLFFIRIFFGLIDPKTEEKKIKRSK